MHDVRSALRAIGVATVAVVAALAWSAPAPAQPAAPAAAVPAVNVEPTDVFVVNAVPDLAFDLWVSDGNLPQKVAENVQPGATTPAFQLFGGTYDAVAVVPGGEPQVPGDVLFQENISVPTSDVRTTTWSLVACVIGGAPNFRFFEEQMFANTQPWAWLRWRHVADAPPVQVVVDGKVEEASLGPGETYSLEVFEDSGYDVAINELDGTPIAAWSSADAKTSASVNVNFYLSGSATDPDFPPALYAQPIKVGSEGPSLAAPSVAPAAATELQPSFTG